jgi:hypothetical protein
VADTLDDWPGLSVIYLRVPWSFLEPREGQFNWSLFDTPAQKWIDHGKQIAIRVTCSESWMRYATPKWVQEAGAKGVDFEFGKGVREGGPQWEPDFADPVFLSKLDAFLAAMAARYDGNPNVAFIDIGSFGMWGEGHTGNSTNLSEEVLYSTVLPCPAIMILLNILNYSWLMKRVLPHHKTEYIWEDEDCMPSIKSHRQTNPLPYMPENTRTMIPCVIPHDLLILSLNMGEVLSRFPSNIRKIPFYLYVMNGKMAGEKQPRKDRSI